MQRLTNLLYCGDMLRLFKQRKFNLWYCGDMLRLFEAKVNKYVVLCRYTSDIWHKGKQICGIMEIYSDYLEQRFFFFLYTLLMLVWALTHIIGVWYKRSGRGKGKTMGNRDIRRSVEGIGMFRGTWDIQDGNHRHFQEWKQIHGIVETYSDFWNNGN